MNKRNVNTGEKLSLAAIMSQIPAFEQFRGGEKVADKLRKPGSKKIMSYFGQAKLK